jgi:hypothetical protein
MQMSIDLHSYTDDDVQKITYYFSRLLLYELTTVNVNNQGRTV